MLTCEIIMLFNGPEKDLGLYSRRFDTKRRDSFFGTELFFRLNIRHRK